MTTIRVKPFRRLSTTSPASKTASRKDYIKNNIKNVLSKSENGTKGDKVKKVDPFEASVIEDLYRNTDLFTSGETKLDLNAKDGSEQQEEEDQDVRMLWRNFMEDTSMHGIKHVNQQQQYKLRRIIWLVAVIGMGSFMAFSLYTLFDAYAKYPTLSKINFEMVDELPFPAVTICNISPFKKSALNGDAKLDYYFLSTSRMSPFLDPMNYTDPANVEYNKPLDKTWLTNMSRSNADIFAYCLESNQVVPCDVKLTSYVTDNGLCFTYNSHEYGKQYGAINTSVTGSSSAPTFYIYINQDEYVYNQDMAAGAKIVLHDPTEEPDVVNKAIVASPGFATYVSVKMTKYKYQPAPFKATADKYCEDTKTNAFVNPLRYKPVYSRYGCLRQCKRDYVVGNCGCRSFFDPGNETICSLAQYHMCYTVYAGGFDSNATLHGQCDCKLECEFTKYDASVSATYFPANVYTNILNSLNLTNHRTDWIEVRVFFDTLSYLSVEQVPEYTPEMLVGVIGGQMGIFLGASLLTLSELAEFLILSLCVVCKRAAIKRRNRKF